MSNWTIYYNPKCGTCRNALELLKKNKVEPRVIEYLKNPPTLAELKELARKLGPAWTEMIREKEPIYAELKLDDGKKSQNDLLKAIAENPILLQRPLVVNGDRAVVARPAEKVDALF